MSCSDPHDRDEVKVGDGPFDMPREMTSVADLVRAIRVEGNLGIMQAADRVRTIQSMRARIATELFSHLVFDPTSEDTPEENADHAVKLADVLMLRLAK